jgi:RNA polymerase sigma-70 factor (ECF subfamily)
MSAVVEPKGLAAEDADTALALRAGHGDREAFADLIGRNYDRIHRVAAKWCGGGVEADDIAQEVCVKLAAAVRGFDARSRFSSWLYRIVLNAVRDRQRQKSREARRDRSFAETLSDGEDPDAEERLMAKNLWDAVRALPGKQCDAVLLVYAEEMSHADAAEVLGISAATVSWYVHEARKALKEVLA